MSRKQGQTAEQTREDILRAAARLLAGGAAKLTLEGTAKAAQVSKGGLIYHFPSKDSLLVALAEQTVAAFREDLEAAQDPLDGEARSFTRCFIRAALSPSVSGQKTRDSMFLMSFLLRHPEAAAVIRSGEAELTEQLASDGVDPDTLALIIAATDGVHIAPMWGGKEKTAAELERITEQLLALTRV
ncbi:TetR family transcriptional regulator [Leucobacter sp. OH1287]|uniref:TetR family transcriptional regulator n=1 Tax=Leucobacter sp. OH1287 TaxID=2491049 RepID=UPI000F5F95A6|nr:TetR family transcriptional regulator [Leucobacter sp. OH1287]RRD60818.1 TetR/AcrR family transcriptional regulator [Leucobacter sp. OH1287]